METIFSCIIIIIMGAWYIWIGRSLSAIAQNTHDANINRAITNDCLRSISARLQTANDLSHAQHEARIYELSIMNQNLQKANEFAHAHHEALIYELSIMSHENNFTVDGDVHIHAEEIVEDFEEDADYDEQ